MRFPRFVLARDRGSAGTAVRAAQRAIFHLLDEPVPTLADPFPKDDPLPGAYELHLPSDGSTIWCTVTPYDGSLRKPWYAWRHPVSVWSLCLLAGSVR